MNIVIVSSSPRSASITHRLALHLQQRLVAETPHQVQILDVREWKLPLLNEGFSSVETAPEPYQPLVKMVLEAHAFILVTPEYNGSYSAALGNLFDHFPKQSRKAFGLVTASTGGFGGMRATQQLLLLVPALFGIASPHMLVTPFVDRKFDASGQLLDEGFKKSIDNFLKEFLWLGETLAPVEQAAQLYN